ncbi:hypothetical protein CJO84_13945 [Ralstonia solanacearum]|nr:hypothetical protein CJO84_13945 [Ralstonia solanacearum]
MDSSHRVRAILSFVQAATTGSFAAAGRVLGISSAAVSKNVAGLEKALKVRLMNRTTRTLQLTEEGAVFLRQARLALEALDVAVDAVAAKRDEPTGRVRISTSAAFGRQQLMPMLPGLLARYPGLSVLIDFDDRIVDLVRDGYDLALRGGHMRDSALVSRPVCRLNKILVASPGYLAHHAVPRMIEDLQQHKLVARRFLGARWMPGASKRKTAVSRRLIRRIQRSSRCPRRKLLLKPQSMASVLRRWGCISLGTIWYPAS